MFHRSGETRLFEFDQNGTFVREIGQGLYGLRWHAVRVDPQDNIWTVDEGTDVVVKFSPDGKVQMVLGQRGSCRGVEPTPGPGTPPPRLSPIASDGRPISRGILRTTSSSLTDTPIRAW